MLRRLLITLACLVALLLGGYVTLWATAPTVNVSRSASEAIQIGWTRQQVADFIGGQPGDYRAFAMGRSKFSTDFDIEAQQTWIGDTGILWVWFDESGTVYGKQFLSCDLSLLGRIRQVVGL
jgi:hypothetical protein